MATISTVTEQRITAAITADLNKTPTIGTIAPFALFENETREGFFVRFQYMQPCLKTTTRWLCFNPEGEQIDCDPNLETDLYQNMVLIKNLVWNT